MENPLAKNIKELVSLLKDKWQEKYLNMCFLKSIEINDTGYLLRGIKQGKIDINFPLTVICGSNGTGKTTFLQLAISCFHAPSRPLTALNKSYNYFRFNDFFQYTVKDKPQQGVSICFEYTKEWNAGQKKLNIVKGKDRWMRYLGKGNKARRPEKGTEFIGISRIVPAFEKKAYQSRFAHKNSKPVSYSKKMNEYMSEIFHKKYEYSLFEYSDSSGKYKLNDYGSYTSFNAGAGEECIANILSALLSCPENSIVAIEEIEIGIHPACLKPLIRVILDIINTRTLQVILTSHSPSFLRNCPRESLVWLRRCGDSCNFVSQPNIELVIQDVGAKPEKLVHIFCEDSLTSLFIEEVIKRKEERDVLRIVEEGGNSNLPDKACADCSKFKIDKRKCLIVYDGDVREDDTKEKQAKERAENHGFDWAFLPSTKTPESYIADKIESNMSILNEVFDIDEARGSNMLQEIKSLKHKEMHNIFLLLSTRVGNGDSETGITETKRKIVRYICQKYSDEFLEIKEKIQKLIKA